MAEPLKITGHTIRYEGGITVTVITEAGSRTVEGLDFVAALDFDKLGDEDMEALAAWINEVGGAEPE